MSTIYPAKEGPNDGAGASTTGKKSDDEKLLERIRTRFTYLMNSWKHIRDEGALDMMAQSVLGPWTPDDRAQREKQKRPCIHLDQLGQHTNALINEFRLNPIAIKITPSGEGTSKETAELTAARIRAIEYESNATQAYLTAFEGAVCRSYGVFGLKVEYKNWDSFEQSIKVRRFQNPDAVLWDPDCEEADSSDMDDAFVLSRVLKTDFERLYPDATVTSFGKNEVALAPDWFDDDSVQIGEYYYCDEKEREMLQIEGPNGPEKLFLGDLEGAKVKKGVLTYADGTTATVLKQRKTVDKSIKQCLTNGIEILERTDWVGKWIPIFPVLGREKFMRIKGSNRVRRELESYVRLARDAQMLCDYYKTNEAEVVGQVPKNTYMGYEGQFDTTTDWANINQTPTAFAEVKATTEATAQALLPLPQFQSYEPPIQALEIGFESARRALQASIGNYGATRLDDYNVKSGKAINALERQGDMGSYHFPDNLKTAISHCGRCIEEILPKVESGPRTVALRDESGKVTMKAINQQAPNPATGRIEMNRYTEDENARHDVNVGTGPSFQSQREEASAFADTLAQNPAIFAVLGPLIVELKNLGPVGDQMKKVLMATLPPQVAQAYNEDEGQPQIPPEVQQQMQQAMQMIQMLQEQLNKATDQLQSKQMELDSKAQTEQAKIEANKEIEAAKLLANTTMERLNNELEKLKLQVQWDIANLNARTKAATVHEQLTSQEQQMAVETRQAEIAQMAEHDHQRAMQAEQPKTTETEG